MARPRIPRRIFFQPNVTYFKPIGVPIRFLDEVVVSFEEIEAIRLVDYEGMDQKKAGKKMKVSQSTLSRLLKEGRRKISQALVEGKSIKIEGGVFKMAGRGFGRGAGRRMGRMGGFGAGPGGVCVCPKCGYEEPQIRGHPCMSKKCPKCGTQMIRKI